MVILEKETREGVERDNLEAEVVGRKVGKANKANPAAPNSKAGIYSAIDRAVYTNMER